MDSTTAAVIAVLIAVLLIVMFAAAGFLLSWKQLRDEFDAYQQAHVAERENYQKIISKLDSTITYYKKELAAREAQLTNNPVALGDALDDLFKKKG